MTRRRVAVVLAVLTTGVLLAGCAALDVPSTDDPNASDVFEAAFVHGDDLEDVRGERVTTVAAGNETRTERVDVIERPYVDHRSEILESDSPDREGALHVSNASATWQYDPDTGVATVFEPDEPFANDEVRAARAEQADRQLELYDLEYSGTERVADREAHVLAVEAKDEAVTDGLSVLVGDTEFVYALETVDPEEELEVTEWRIWIDVEYEYPLKEEVVVDEYSFTERFETVAFNTGVDDATFAFEPPENATVQTFE